MVDKGPYLPPLCYPCSLLNAGFWRSKFDPNLTKRDVFHLDEQFMVPVEMMEAHSYPLRWSLLEQPEIQVSGIPMLCSSWAWVLRGGPGGKEQPLGKT